jgi:hypothetical protein
MDRELESASAAGDLAGHLETGATRAKECY